MPANQQESVKATRNMLKNTIENIFKTIFAPEI